MHGGGGKSKDGKDNEEEGEKQGLLRRGACDVGEVDVLEKDQTRAGRNTMSDFRLSEQPDAPSFCSRLPVQLDDPASLQTGCCFSSSQ